MDRKDRTNLLKLAIIGSQGIPAKYGGFETLVEFLAKYLSHKLEITVFCSREQYPKLREYNNSHLIYLPFSANGLQGIIYDSISILLSYKKYDKIFILGCSNIVMSLMSRHSSKFILNIGGIEWQRNKWGYWASKLIKYSESISVKNSDYLIADNEGIKNYLLTTYNRESTLIEYGGDQVWRVAYNTTHLNKYKFLTDDYILSIARIQSDNNIEMIIKSFVGIEKYTLVIIGNWDFSEYGVKLRNTYKNNNCIILLDAIYDQELLNVIRSNAKLYVHGHSAGGTNPGLVEAMCLRLPVFCFDNIFNRFTTENKAEYFNASEKLHDMLLNLSDPLLKKKADDMQEIAERRYKWEIIAEKYYSVIVQQELQ
jgi:glycosyltransferase involved in cell wall biosynthesis